MIRVSWRTDAIRGLFCAKADMKSGLGNGILLLLLVLADLGTPAWRGGVRLPFSFLEAGFAVALSLSLPQTSLLVSGFYGIASDIVAGHLPGSGIFPFATVALIFAWLPASERHATSLLTRLLRACLAIMGIPLGRAILAWNSGSSGAVFQLVSAHQFVGTCLFAFLMIVVCHPLLTRGAAEGSGLPSRYRGML